MNFYTKALLVTVLVINATFALAVDDKEQSSAKTFDWRSRPSNEADLGGNAVKGLVVTLSTLFIGLALAKKYYKPLQGTSKRRCRVIERTALTSKTSLLVVEYEGKEILCAVGPDRVSVLSGGKEQFSDTLESECYDQELKLSA